MCALFKSIFIFRQFLALIRIQSKNEMFSKTKQTINNNDNERLKKQRKKDEHTLKQSEIPVMQIWAGQLLLTSDVESGSDCLGLIRPLAIGSWSSDLTLGGPSQGRVETNFNEQFSCNITPWKRTLNSFNEFYGVGVLNKT